MIKKLFLLLAIIYIATITLAGCWNYREIDMMAAIAGIGIDKGEDERYKLTVEIAEFVGERQSVPVGRTITIEGETIFDAARNGIALLGEKLYWSHAKVLILSERVAGEGVTPILDWFSRDSETREDINILIAKGSTPKDILEGKGGNSGVKSFEMGTMMRNQRNLSKAPKVEVWQFVNNLQAKGIVATSPSVYLEEVNGKRIPKISGTAVFKKDQLLGYLDEEETKIMLFIQDEINGGLLVLVEEDSGREMPITLEIFKSKTKVEPVVNNETIKFNIKIETTVALAELGGTKDYIKEEEERKKLELLASEKLKEKVMQLVSKMQNQLEVDIFGFGEDLRRDKPKLWKKMENNWHENFRNVSVNVSAKISIKNSAMLSKPLEVGE